MASVASFPARPTRSQPAIPGLTPFSAGAVVVAWIGVAVTLSWLQLAKGNWWELVVLNLLVTGIWFLPGVLMWYRRPGSVFGPVMVLQGFLIWSFALSWWDTSWTRTFSRLFAEAHIYLLAWLVLAFPTGRIRERSARYLVWFIVVYGFAVQVAYLLAGDWEAWCAECAPDPLQITADAARWVDRLDTFTTIVTPVVALAYIAVLARRFIGFRGAQRLLLPVWIGGAAIAVFYVLQPVQDRLDLDRGGWVTYYYLLNLFTLAAPLSFAYAIVRDRQLQGPIGRLIDDLSTHPGEGLEDALARALGDPTVQVLYLRADGSGHTNSAGQPATPPPSTDPARGTTALSHGGTALGVLVHDPALLAEPELVQSVCAAAGLALANERLRAEVRARLAEVRASRVRIVEAGDAERRRLERNLHDGAQQRLVALRLGLRMAAAQVEEPSPQSASILRESADELDRAIAELREIAHGLHPSVLTDEGLAAAIQVLVERARMAVDLEMRIPGHIGPQVETAAYYVVAESLANVAKHAAASAVHVSLATTPDGLAISVSDNGTGGASLSAGTGLLGIQDRVEAIGGTFELRSLPGEGTTIRALLPVQADE